MPGLNRRQEWVCEWSLRTSPWWQAAWVAVGAASVAAAWLGSFSDGERMFMAAMGGAIVGHAIALTFPTSLTRLIARLYREGPAREVRPQA